VPDDRPFRQKDVVEYPLILQATNRYIKVSHTYLFRHIFSVVSSYFSIFYRYSEWPLAGRSWVRNPVTERFSAPLQTGCGFHPVSATTGVGPFTGLNGPWRDIDIPPSSTAEIKESVNLHLHNPPPPIVYFHGFLYLEISLFYLSLIIIFPKSWQLFTTTKGPSFGLNNVKTENIFIRIW